MPKDSYSYFNVYALLSLPFEYAVVLFFEMCNVMNVPAVEPGNKYFCWINKEEQILSFHYVEGYIMVEFDSHEEFQNFYYQKSYNGYRIQ